VLCSFTALDEYFDAGKAPLKFQYFNGELIELASVTEDLEYPSLPYADAVLNKNNSRILYQCLNGSSFPGHRQLGLLYSPEKRFFDGKNGVYESLRQTDLEPLSAPPELLVFESAVLCARYAYTAKAENYGINMDSLSADYQRDLLELILSSAHPEKGFEFLLKCGFLERFWPELAELASVVHTKDYHPEGDAWRHTMETFSYRKNRDIRLSIGLLLHDIGKAAALPSGNRRFDRHSELGEKAARKFLGRLAYSGKEIDDIAFLVRYHMLPAALPRIAPSNISHILFNPLFPELLELYRCDELSTYRGPDAYYEACAAYKTFLKHSKNPYRNMNGKTRGAYSTYEAGSL